MFHVPEKFRSLTNEMRIARETCVGEQRGCFLIPPTLAQTRRGILRPLFCIASNAEHAESYCLPPWEHVSVSLPGETRCPSWLDMCFIKSLFWDPEDCVVQYHPPEADYVSEHNYCLHLWRPVGVEIPRPPSIMVGVKKRGN